MVYLAMLYSNIYRKYLAINTRIDEQLDVSMDTSIKMQFETQRKVESQRNLAML